MRSIIPWRRERDTNPTTSISRFRSDIDRLFDRFFEPMGWKSGELGMESWMPAIDVKDTPNEVTVCAELPGLKPEEIEVSVSGNVLCVSGERKEEKNEEREGYYARERRYGSFCRNIELPPGAETDRISAEYLDGELTIHIPKSENSRSRKVPVQAARREIAKIQPRQDSPSAPTRTNDERQAADTDVATISGRNTKPVVTRVDHAGPH